MKYKVLSIKKSRIWFLLLFIFLGFIALQIPISNIAGSRVNFTLFDLFAPISGAFLGSIIGIIAVSAMQLANLIIHGFSGVQADSLLKLLGTLRILPMIFGVLYFALAGKVQKSNWILLVPFLSIVTFNLHPIGRTVWFYSLFWLIPLATWPIRQRFLVTRALGSTFTAHAVGGAIWIWAFNLPAAVWISLIPIVILERSIFALGISASYILINNLLGFLESRKILLGQIVIDKKYLLAGFGRK